MSNALRGIVAYQFPWCAVVCVLLTLGLACAAEVQPVPVQFNAELKNVSLDADTYILEDKSGTLAFDDIRDDRVGKMFVHAVARPGNTASAYWIRWRMINPNTQPVTAWLDTGNRTLQELELHWRDAQGSFQRTTTGSRVGFFERPLPTSAFVFPLVLPPGEVVDVYLRARTTGYLGLSLAPKLWSPAAYREQMAAENIRWTLFLGLGLALSVVNLMIFVFNRDRASLLYVLTVLANILSVSKAVGGYGPAFEWWWPNSPRIEQAAWLGVLIFPMICTNAFISHLVDLPRHYPRLARTMYVSMGVAVCLMLVQILATLLGYEANVELRQTLYTAGALVWSIPFACSLAALLGRSRAGAQVARLVAVGFIPTLMIMPVSAYTTIAYGVLYSDFNMGLFVFEWLVMAVAVALHVHHLNLERMTAQEALLTATQQNERDLERKVEERTRALQAEQQKSADLLRNMLPAQLIQELALTGTTRPVRHASATILFTDFCGFTQAASTMPADLVVAELDDIFGAFDDICDSCGIEKIKTIGDAYMAAGGVPVSVPDHAQRCVRAGLRMVAHMAERNRISAFKWGLRVGIHSGPVVAGVVGKRKYAFDVWGDTVNIASRMESAGEVGQVNVSAYTCDLIRDSYASEYRGKISARGKGEIDMYFVIPPDVH